MVRVLNDEAPPAITVFLDNLQDPIARVNLPAAILDKLDFNSIQRLMEGLPKIFRPQLNLEDSGQVTDTAGEESMAAHRSNRGSVSIMKGFAFFYKNLYPKMSVTVTRTIISY
ncbi:hypothetical protein BTUL_0087g00130 [Botrytis tulipae]|uniref:Uncharacterized protein n=1 Tax=Botrytis tulipae TaxID=87230 RepID=A0A4Z1ELT1_9HELO|nr:hypothetical protein BTUL_0087g00130 [Botrytis tulipae]